MVGSQQETVIRSAPDQDSPRRTQKGPNLMRRKRFQRGSVKPRKRKGRLYWYAQWRESGTCRSKELGLCSLMSRGEAEVTLAAILQPINVDAGLRIRPVYTFKQFVEVVYLPVCRGKWKVSTGMTEGSRLQAHLTKTLGQRPMHEIHREDLQSLLDSKSRNLARSVEIGRAHV